MQYRNLLSYLKLLAGMLLMLAAMSATAFADSGYSANLDGAQAGSNSAATGFAVAFVEPNGIVRIRVRTDGLAVETLHLANGVQIRDENDAFVDYVQMNSLVDSVLNTYDFTPVVREKLRAGKLRIRVHTTNYPNGEIAGPLLPYSMYTGHLTPDFDNSSTNPNATGFSAAILDKNQTRLFFYYRMSGLPADGNGLFLDSTPIESNFGSSYVNIGFRSGSQLDAAFLQRLRRGLVSVSIVPNQAVGFLKPLNRVVDFNGDNRADYSVYRPSTGTWYWKNIRNQSSNSVRFGANGDIPAPADFDGDGRTDYSLWRPSSGVFYVLDNATGGFNAVQWGKSGDTPFTADFDGDGKSDFAVYRPGAANTQSTFWILKSSGGSLAIPFGLGSDYPLVSDFDGDRVADVTVFRPSNGTFYSIDSSTGQFRAKNWGLSSDIPFTKDVDGDGKSDYVVVRAGATTQVWYVLTSSSGFTSYSATSWGTLGANPMLADFSGDGRADFASYSSGAWAYRDAFDGSVSGTFYGLANDTPLQNR